MTKSDFFQMARDKKILSTELYQFIISCNIPYLWGENFFLRGEAIIIYFEDETLLYYLGDCSQHRMVDQISFFHFNINFHIKNCKQRIEAQKEWLFDLASFQERINNNNPGE